MTSNNSPRSNSSSDNDVNEDDEDGDQENNDDGSASDESSSSIKSSDCSNSTSSLSSNADANPSFSRDPSEPSRTARVDASCSGEQRKKPRIRKRGREPETQNTSRARIEIDAMETISAPNPCSHFRTDPPRSYAETDEKQRSHNTGNQDSSTLSDLTGLVLQQQQLLLQCMQGSQRSRDGASTHPTAAASAANKSTSTQETESSNRPIGNPALQLQPQHLQLLSLLLANHDKRHQQQQQPPPPLNVANSASLDPNAHLLLSLLLKPTTAVATAPLMPSPAPAAPTVNNNDFSSLLLQLSGGGQRTAEVASPSPPPVVPPQLAPLTVITSLIASLQQSLSSSNAIFAAPVATVRPLDPYAAPASNPSSAYVQQQISALLGQIAQAAANPAAAAAPRLQPPPAQPLLQASNSNNLLLDFIRSTLQNANLPAVEQQQPIEQQQQQRSLLPSSPPSVAAANDAASQLLLQMYAQGLLLQAPPVPLVASTTTTMNPKLSLESKQSAAGVFQRVDIKALPMATATDKTQISPYQQLIRQQLEFFVSDQEDVDYGVQGRKKRVRVGQVGIRCQHCADLPLRQRGRGAVYYPTKLAGVYQAAQNMAVNHLNDFCHRLNAEIRNRLLELRNSKETASGGSKKYWAEACAAVGLYEDEDGLRFHVASAATPPL